jgi:putative transposase
LAGRVLLTIVYLLVRRVLGLAVLIFCGDLAKDAELLVLRHENAVLRRHAGRIRYEPADRVWFTVLTLPLPKTSSVEVRQHARTRGGCRRGGRVVVCRGGLSGPDL